MTEGRVVRVGVAEIDPGGRGMAGLVANATIASARIGRGTRGEVGSGGDLLRTQLLQMQVSIAREGTISRMGAIGGVVGKFGPWHDLGGTAEGDRRGGSADVYTGFVQDVGSR